jgi:predicted dehydrogenase
VLINQCAHQLDLLQWLVGKMPVSVRGFCHYGKWHDVEVEDDVTAYLTYDNGATGVFITTTGEMPGSNRLEVSGTAGKLLCEQGKLYLYKNAEDSAKILKEYPQSFWTQPSVCEEIQTDRKNPQHVGIINNFTNALLGKEKLFVLGTDGINGVELMNAIEFSGWKNGEEVTLPVDENEYIRELEKHCASSEIKKTKDGKAENNTVSYGSAAMAFSK